MMKNFLFLIFISTSLISCDFKDNSGNAPLVQDENGYLIDNPDYIDPVKQEADEKREKEVKHIQKSMRAWADSASAADKEKK